MVGTFAQFLFIRAGHLSIENPHDSFIQRAYVEQAANARPMHVDANVRRSDGSIGSKHYFV